MSFYRKLNLVNHFAGKFCTSVNIECHPERERMHGGRVEIRDPDIFPVQVVVVPMMNLRLQKNEFGEFVSGLAEMYIDREVLLAAHGITLNTRLDYVQYHGSKYKLVKMDDYGCQTNIEIYLIQSLPEGSYDQ